jgi:hypothetical protein
MRPEIVKIFALISYLVYFRLPLQWLFSEGAGGEEEWEERPSRCAIKAQW